jgi:hypothetical protein
LKQSTQIFFMAKARCFELDRMLVIPRAGRPRATLSEEPDPRDLMQPFESERV